MKTYNLFISHSWAYSGTYGNLVKLLEKRSYFRFRNYSVPKDAPISTNGSDRRLHKAICSRMRLCSVILIPAGVYASYSEWIEKEIEIAKKKFSVKKPVVAIRPRGSERISALVKDNADTIVGWNTESIVSAIRNLV